jgi:Tyrosine phosphatase family
MGNCFSNEDSKAAKAKNPNRLDFTKDIPTEEDIPYPPFINVEGVPNFRDIGGYSCPAPTQQIHSNGGPEVSDPLPYSVRRNFAFRCSELSQLTPRGHTVMTTDLGIKVLFDLRSEIEAARLIGRPKGIKIVSTPVFPIADIRAHPEMASQQLRWYTAPDIPADAGFSQGYVDCYRDIALHGVKAFRTIFEHIRDHPEQPFVYHCTAGKDRTGVLTALIQKICGVDDEAVAWDYSLTVPGMGKWEEMVEAEMIGDSMTPVGQHRGMTMEEAKRVCGSRSANMKAWLEKVLEKEFGGAERYCTGKLGFTPEDVAKIKGNLVAQAPPTVAVKDVKGWEDHPQT